MKFIRIKINDGLADGCVQRLKIHFQAELRGTVKALGIVADEKSAHSGPTFASASDNGKHVDDGQVPQETIGRAIEDVAHRILSAAHDALHPINRAQVMAAVDRL